MIVCCKEIQKVLGPVSLCWPVFKDPHSPWFFLASCLVIYEQWLRTEASRWCSGTESTYQCRRCWRCEFDPWIGKIPWRRKWQPTPVFFPGKSHGQRSLPGYSPWDHRESDMTEWLSTHARLRTTASVPCLCLPSQILSGWKTASHPLSLSVIRRCAVCCVSSQAVHLNCWVGPSDLNHHHHHYQRPREESWLSLCKLAYRIALDL